ncbi:ATP-binding protein [Pannus brasiliensis CCIBt3594]|uniref:histidine kinase n=1 Tax=Pannus brasiliensis CCIBt3594 TaxID=1427578 RepID=A0AAW9QFF1_9CHRO
MVLTDFIQSEEVNLNNCDREPIHIPGSVQPHGILLVLSENDFQIERVSENTLSLLGIESDRLLGTPLSRWLDGTQIETLQNCLKGDFEQINPLELLFRAGDRSLPFDGILHRSPRGQIILELEPNITRKSDFLQFYQKAKVILDQMHGARDLDTLCHSIARTLRKITGFDRVMLYRFDPDGSGTVIAEDKIDELESYLGLHYPDTDIPKQAKYLYTLNWLRLIPDANYRPAKILGGKEEEPIDLSFSTLRSVSPIHIEYMHNMGVAASMSISLVREGELWGLIACHHHEPKFLPYESRTLCEFLGQVLSIEIAGKEEKQDLDAKIRLKTIQTQFIDAISRSNEFTDALVSDRSRLLELVRAEGVAICSDGHLTLVGKTPDETMIQALIEWLSDRFTNNLFVTDSLAKLYPPAGEFAAIASGLLAISITRIQRNYVLWFRPEILQQVTWAGNPEKPQRVEADGTLTIFPRQSFAAWRETVRGKSLPWLSSEIEGALELRSAIVGIILRKADELAAINLELERSNNELDAFAYIASHDLKEPLRGIHNYSTFLLEDYGNILERDGVEKLETLVRLTKRMEDLINSLLHFSRLGRQELNLQTLDLNRLLNNVSEVIRMSYGKNHLEIAVPRPLPAIRGDRILIEEVLTNLIGNGFKYNKSGRKRVEIGYLDSEKENEDYITFCIRDNGIGIRERHLEAIFRIFKRLHAPGAYGGGTGAGLTIVKKIIERHGGTIWVESVYGSGSTFYFTLPKG